MTAISRPLRPAGARIARALLCAIVSFIPCQEAFVGGSGAEAAALLERARAAHAEGRAREALALYDRALDGFRKAGDDTGAAVCLNNSSVLLLSRGDIEGSLTRAREAVRLRRALGDVRLVGRSLTNSGRALQQMGRLDEAEADFEAALRAAEEAGDARDAVVNHLNLGVVTQARGRYGEALARIRRAFELIDGHPGEPWASTQRIIGLNNRGALYEHVGEFRPALDDYEAILGLVEDGAASVPYRVNAATILRNLGDADLALRRLKEAERILLGAGGDAALHANLLSNVGLVLHLNLRRTGEALEVFRRARAMARAAGDREEAARIGNYIGAALLDLGRYDEGAATYRGVLADLSASSILDPAWEAHLGLARTLRRRGDREGTRRALLTAAALVEGSRIDLQSEMAPRRFLADRLIVYAMLASARAEEGGEAGARAGLLAAERARRRLLLSGWSRPHRRAPEGERRALKQDLARLSEMAASLYAGEDGRLEAAWEEMERPYEEDSRGRQVPPVAADEALVEYLIAGEESRVFWLTRARAGTIRLPAESRMERLSLDWLDDLVGGTARAAHEAGSGRRLYEAVLLPVLESLPPGIRRLRIVPDGSLWRVPLDALPTGPARDTGARPGDEAVRAGDGPITRLLHSYEVSLAPILSVSGEAVAGGKGGEPALTYAVFGPPGASELAAALGDGSRVVLPPLPEADREARAVRRALGRRGQVFFGGESRESSLKRLGGEGVAVLHVATHALVDPFDIGRTGIVLSGGGDRTGGEGGHGGPPGGEDGFLTLSEILDLDLPVDLTFLSACSGAVGDRLPGEGLDSLAGALIESGSQSVVASLWDVEDLPASALVEQFYDRVRRGRTFAAALREAKLALLSSGGEMARPRHWAAWVLVGRAGARVVQTGMPAGGRAAIAASLVLLLAGAIYAALRLAARRMGRPRSGFSAAPRS